MRPRTMLAAIVVVGGLFAASTAVNAGDVKRDIDGEAKLHRGYSFTTIDVPVPGVGEAQAIRINDWGLTVRLYTTSGSLEHGFLDDRGVFSPIVAPFPAPQLSPTAYRPCNSICT